MQQITVANSKAQYEAFADTVLENRDTAAIAFALRDAAEFLEHAAEMIAQGKDMGGVEVMKRITWARWKVIEVLSDETCVSNEPAPNA